MRLIPQSWKLNAFKQRRGGAEVDWDARSHECIWEMPASMRDRFGALGYNQRRPFFPHEIRCLPKAGPDAHRLAGWMTGSRDANGLWEILLHASTSAREGLPPELFFDDDIVWHRQHLGLPGHIAYGCVLLRGRDVYGLNYVADVVQRIGRRREHKTKIETRFRGWPSLLLNSIMAFAVARGKHRVFSPTADWVLHHTDPEREVQRALFDRVYDQTVEQAYRARRTDRWWIIDVAENRDRIILPEPGIRDGVRARTIALCHDLERGWGHRASHPHLAAGMDEAARAALPAILDAERNRGVHVTYNVVGAFLNEVRDDITGNGHALGFHSFDHDLRGAQLERCRGVDYRIQGYRPPQSRPTRELSDRNLCSYNFGWLASAASVLRVSSPTIENRVIKMPIAQDDYPLFTGELTYDQWEARALALVERSSFSAISLHDCYAAHWLPHYPAFLEKLGRLGELRTLDDVAAELWLANGR